MRLGGGAEGLTVASALCAATGCILDTVEQVGVGEQAIVGGVSTADGDYPATGTLVQGHRARCTATLVTPDVALTAAHCLNDSGFGGFGFTLDPDLSDGITGEIVPVLQTHAHPDFTPSGDEYLDLARRNDIGVFILEHPIEGVAVEVIDGTTGAAEVHAGSELEMCGYGRDVWWEGRSEGTKRSAWVLVDRLASWELGTVADGAQPCRGDSGGPLFADTPAGRRIVGLVSRAMGASQMCDSGAIVTRVAPYLDWIQAASADRDADGCSAAGGGAGSGAWLALVAALAHRLGRRRRAGSAAAPRSAAELI